MLCINVNVLTSLGTPNEVISAAVAAPGNGLFISGLFSFGGGGNGGRDLEVLLAEPEPRRLFLVGMADRYGEAARRLATIRELAVTNGVERLPDRDEVVMIMRELARITHPQAAAIADSIRNWHFARSGETVL